MPRGRKPIPAHLKILRGGRDRGPIVDNEPKPTRGELPEPPQHLTMDDARQEWMRLRDELYHLGLLTVADLNVFAAYCTVYARWVIAERSLAAMAARDELTRGLMIKTTNGNAVQNPLVGTAHRAAELMVKYAAELGLTPAARARLAAGPAPQASKFEGLIG